MGPIRDDITALFDRNGPKRTDMTVSEVFGRGVRDLARSRPLRQPRCALKQNDRCQKIAPQRTTGPLGN